MLKAEGPARLTWDVRVLPGEHHVSARYPSLREGLRAMFAALWPPWDVLSESRVDQLSSQPGAYEGCYLFLTAKEDQAEALRCAEDALAAARRMGQWTGKIEVTLAKLRRTR